MNALRGKVALVTGASRGIGAAIAQRLASEGAAVAITARTLESDGTVEGSLRDTLMAIEKAGGAARPIVADLSDPDSRPRIVEEAVAAFGPVDILVNNAAVTFFRPAAEFPRRRFDLMFSMQVQAPFELAQLVLPPMRERKAGWILNISSRARLDPPGPPYPAMYVQMGMTVYGMCKAALERFTTGLASEVYADGIAVNALSPVKVVPTPGAIAHNLVSDPSSVEREEYMAEAALALCSGDPATLTGRITYSLDLLRELGREPRALDGSPATG
jgi:NAD(P)-dependent dehydrogenase (short-subunit alcohol dehydrogenase family)